MSSANASTVAAPPSWSAVDFISDLHLQSGDRATAQVFFDYLKNTTASALFILGDWLEVWVGDDALQAGGFEQQCAEATREAARRFPIYFLHGNRDFLLGDLAEQACGFTVLQDPSVLEFAGRRWLLSHGDALCKDDVDYMAFRAMVRAKPWQSDFLAKPLAQRQALATHMRLQSEALKRGGSTYADVDTAAAIQWLQQADSKTLIHGHTHAPAEHALGENGLRRIVLSDWDLAATPPRAQVLRLSAHGIERIPLA